MVSVDEAVIARNKFENKNFEVLVDCEKALELKEGKAVDMSDVMATDMVFSDSAKGLAASEADIQKVFRTQDAKEAAKQIIQKGDVQLTADHRKKIKDAKKKQIMSIIHRNGIDPKTNLPHPQIRLENAFEEARVHIDEHKPVEKQVEEIVQKLRPILPIRFVIKEVAVKVPAQFAGKAHPLLKGFGKLLRDEWLTDGSWIAVVEIPGGLEEDLTDSLNNMTHGDVELKILNTR